MQLSKLGFLKQTFNILDAQRCISNHLNPFFPPLQIVRPISSFLIVDVQNDFISGSLNISNCSAQQNGLEVGRSVSG